MASPRPEQAAQLTACLRSRYGQAVPGLNLHSTSVTPDMTSYHAFGEIHPNTPAAIIETGFLNRDREMLTGQTDKVAQGVANGILCFLRNEPITLPAASPIPATQPTLAPTMTPTPIP
jgi:N-acetylmuramoyl-L-alanine amidase